MLHKDYESDVSKIVVDCIFCVHKALGPGLLESSYEACLLHEIRKRGLYADNQVVLPILYDGLKVDAGYRIDIIIENELILELKAVEKMIPLYQAQMITYLRHSEIKTGLLINFNAQLIRNGIQRISL